MTRRPALTAGVLALAVFLASPLHVQSDSAWSIPVAVSLLKHGVLDLDEYRPTIARHPSGVVSAGGHEYGLFPVMVSVVAIPFLVVFDAAARIAAPVPIPLVRHLTGRWQSHLWAEGDVDLEFFDTLEMIIASVLVATGAALLTLGLRGLAGAAPAMASGLVLALATSAYSTASRVLWQHSLSIALAGGVLAVILTGSSRWRSLAAGALLGIAYVNRPTNAILGAAVLAYLLAARPRWNAALCAAAIAAVLIPFAAWSHHTFGTLLPPYYAATRLGLGPQMPEALAANLVSPGRGLFFYSPVLLFALPSALRVANRRCWHPFEPYALAAAGAHWIAISAFPHWWAGHSYGPRFFTDVTPLIIFLLVPALASAIQAPARHRGRTLVLALSLAASAGIHAVGASSWRAYAWNMEPSNIDDAPQRVWDWADPPFLRPFRSPATANRASHRGLAAGPQGLPCPAPLR